MGWIKQAYGASSGFEHLQSKPEPIDATKRVDAADPPARIPRPGDERGLEFGKHLRHVAEMVSPSPKSVYEPKNTVLKWLGTQWTEFVVEQASEWAVRDFISELRRLRRIYRSRRGAKSGDRRRAGERKRGGTSRKTAEGRCARQRGGERVPAKARGPSPGLGQRQTPSSFDVRAQRGKISE